MSEVTNIEKMRASLAALKEIAEKQAEREPLPFLVPPNLVFAAISDGIDSTAELVRLRAENERLRETISAFDELTAWVGYNSNIDWDKVSADPVDALDGINRRVAEVIFRADRDLPACAALGEQP